MRVSTSPGFFACLFGASLALGCGDSVAADSGPTTLGEAGDESGSGSGDGDMSGDGDGDGDPMECSCAPGTDLIYVISKFAELYSYDPIADTFTSLGELTCGSGLVYSMAVDHDGRGWILDLDSRDLFTIELDDPTSCTEPPWVPGNGGFGYFGMGFVSNDTLDVCEKLYLHSYSGEGAFIEGEDLGQLGVYDPADGSLEILAPVDFDGGEIDGTGDGRLFALAGEEPVKLVEYERDTGAVVEIFPLEGVSKTTASAFAFHSGDFYIFTEGTPPGCFDCLEACTPTYQECMADPVCAESFQCGFEAGDFTDECGGLIPQELADCLSNTCLEACFPVGGKRSKVTRVDWDESEGNGKAIEVVNEMAPIRVVGAGTSICAPLQVP